MATAIVFIFGLGFGSFVNALVWRLHQQAKSSKPKAQSKKPKKKKGLLSASQNRYSILTGRSMCPHCKHQLASKDLVPVISWLWLKGKCRYCKKPISPQYPAVELLTAGLFVTSYILWPFTLSLWLSAFSFAVWLGILTLLIALAVYDIKWMELPDKLVLYVTIGSVGLVLSTSFIDGNGVSVLVSSLWGSALLSSFFYLLFQVSKGKWIGGGDVKLAPALGLLAGSPLKALLLLFVASLIGSIIGIPLLLRRKQKHHIKLPFGPLLIIGLFFVFFFGQDAIDWYTNNILYL